MDFFSSDWWITILILLGIGVVIAFIFADKDQREDWIVQAFLTAVAVGIVIGIYSIVKALRGH